MGKHTYMHWSEFLKFPVDDNLVLIRPKHWGHVKLEKRYKFRFTAFSVSWKHIVQLQRTECIEQCTEEQHVHSELCLTLLFSLSITPKRRTLMGSLRFSISGSVVWFCLVFPRHSVPSKVNTLTSGSVCECIYQSTGRWSQRQLGGAVYPPHGNFLLLLRSL